MERHYELMRKFREVEFSRKLNRARETRLKGYEDEIIKEGDLVFYQHQDKKAWLGPVRVFSIQKNSVFLFANGSMRKIPRCNVQLWNPEGENGEAQQFSPFSETGQKNEDKDQTECNTKSPTVNFEEESFGEDMNEKEIEEIGRWRTQSMMAVERREL